MKKYVLFATLLSSALSAFAIPQPVVVQNTGKDALQVEVDFNNNNSLASIVDLAPGAQTEPLLVDDEIQYMVIHLVGMDKQRIACPIKSNEIIRACFDASGSEKCEDMWNWFCG